MRDRYSEMGDLAMFGFLANAFEGGGDKGATFPRSDAEDLSRGCRFIPGEVTMARRRGEMIIFHSECSQNCWYWEMEDGSRIYHFDPLTYDRLKGEGHCARCGNTHIRGGRIPKEEL